MWTSPAPNCGLPAEVTATWSWPSTSGDVLHAATCCAAGHRLTIRID